MGYIAFVLQGKISVDHTDELDTYNETLTEAVNIAKSMQRGRPYKIKIFDTDTKLQVGKTRSINGDRFNPRIEKYEQIVNASQGYISTREGRTPVSPADFGLSDFQDPRSSGPGMAGNARDDHKNQQS